MDQPIIIGLTGSFGSGCGILQDVLEKKFKFKGFKLSEEVRQEAKKRGKKEKDRRVLQDIGDDLRKNNGYGYLAEKALEKARPLKDKMYVFRGFRHPEEIQVFREFPNFFLIAVDCTTDNRWKRLEGSYNGDRTAFDRDDRRDKDAKLPYGQQVLRCVEHADIIFANEEFYETPIKTHDKLKERFSPYLSLITGEKMRNPSLDETMMAVAFDLALQSHCIKRQVGAVLCSKDGYIVSGAYNEVPKGQDSCLNKYGMCYRDHVRNKHVNTTIKNMKYCPKCSEEITSIEFLPEPSCSHCRESLNIFPHYKALDKCRSLHAEEATILKTPPFEVDESTLYSTTFPCLQCAKRILQSEIKTVVYVDPYPESEAIEVLEKGGVATKKFEGVKAQAFYKLFYKYREVQEKKVKEQYLQLISDKMLFNREG
jgi:deoxycytidylate deaminase